MTDRELLRRIERSPGQKAGYKQLVRELSLGGGRERRLLLEHLARLTAAGHLVKDDDYWSIPQAPSKSGSRDNLVAGRLDLHRDGFGFVRPTGSGSREDDIFIPPNEIQGAMQGDQVLVEAFPPDRDGRRAGRIVRVLTRRNPMVVGIFHESSGRRRREGIPGNYVRPFDERMNQPILIPDEVALPRPKAGSEHRVLGEEALATQHYEGDSLEGLVVDVEVTEWPTPTRPAKGRVVEVLGHPDDFGIDVEMVIRKHHLPRIFPDNVLAEAKSVAKLDPQVIAERRDFRDLPIVTIDGETARDFDDAVLVEHDESTGSWHLQVHIADVANYVTEGSALDLEARLRGNSVYFPDRAIPMLPQELSTDICSLRPDEDRLVLSCLMEIDSSGNITGYEVTEGVIRSARRMTYTQVHKIIDGDEETRSQFSDLVPRFEQMKQLAEILNRKRQLRGSIDFDLPEPIIEFDEFGAMKSVTRSERNWAHRLIEEFMLSANESVASWLENLGVPSIYRIHEKPEPRRIVEFEDIAASFGYSLGLGNLPVRKFQTRGDRRDRHGSGRNARQHEVPQEMPVSPKMYQKLAAKISGKPEERILSFLMLRSLKQARYSEKNEGHFALAAPSYTHFTSPIRRYPDLIVHRITKALLNEGIDGRGVLSDGEPHAKRKAHSATIRIESVHEVLSEAELAMIAQESSENERRASEAERELVAWKKIKFMQDRVGEDFDGLILSATKYGLFVELDDLFVEGLVPIQSLGALDNDYYTFRENTREIIGEHWGRKFRLGMRVRVLLERIDAIEKRLQFSIVDEEDAAQPAAPKTRAQKAKKKEKKRSKAKGPVPAFAANVAGRPAKKSGKKKRPGSMQQQGQKSYRIPKKAKGKRKK